MTNKKKLTEVLLALDRIEILPCQDAGNCDAPKTGRYFKGPFGDIHEPCSADLYRYKSSQAGNAGWKEISLEDIT